MTTELINKMLRVLAENHINNWIDDPLVGDVKKPSIDDLIRLGFGINSKDIIRYLESLEEECEDCYGHGTTELTSPDPIEICKSCKGHGLKEIEK